MEATTVKYIGTKNFEVVLFQLANGSYIVGYVHQGKDHRMGETQDYNLASFQFDSKVQELEGN